MSGSLRGRQVAGPEAPRQLTVSRMRPPAGWGPGCGVVGLRFRATPSIEICIRKPVHPAPGSTSSGNPSGLWIGSPIPDRFHGAEVVCGFRKHPANGARQTRPPEHQLLQAGAPATPDSQPQGGSRFEIDGAIRQTRTSKRCWACHPVSHPAPPATVRLSRPDESPNPVSDLVEYLSGSSEAEYRDSKSASHPAVAAFRHKIGTWAGASQPAAARAMVGRLLPPQRPRRVLGTCGGKTTSYARVAPGVARLRGCTCCRDRLPARLVPLRGGRPLFVTPRDTRVALFDRAVRL